MARPQKIRFICCPPESNRFGPIDSNLLKSSSENLSKVILTFDEYETIRLIDLLGLDQFECADHMNIARSTVQLIYENARKKIADSIVNNKILVIEGGNYKVCEAKGYKSRLCKKLNCKRLNNR